MKKAIRTYLYNHGYLNSPLQKIWVKITSPISKYRTQKRIKSVHETGMQLLSVINQIAQKHNVVIWPEFGTLLGAYRDKSFISFDPDIDLGMMINDFTPDFMKSLNNVGITPVRSLCRKFSSDGSEVIVEYTLLYRALKFDLFLSEKYGNKRRVYVSTSKIDELKPYYNIKHYEVDYSENVERVSINNFELSYPGNANKYLKSIYGENFMTPIPNWRPPKTNPIMYVWDNKECYSIEHRY